jgi:hypothetical protein
MPASTLAPRPTTDAYMAIEVVIALPPAATVSSVADANVSLNSPDEMFTCP